MGMMLSATAEHTKKVFDWAVTKRLFTYLRPFRKQLIRAFAAAVLTVVAAVVGSPLIGFIVERGVQNRDLMAVAVGVLVYLAADGFGTLGFHLQVRNMSYAGQHVIQKLRDEMFAHIQHLSLSFFSTYETGRLIARVVGDVNVLREALTFAIVGTFRDLMILIGILIAMTLINLPLTLVALAACAALIIVANVWRIYARKAYSAVRETNAVVNAELSEAFNAVRVTQAFAREGFNYRRFAEEKNLAHRKTNTRAALISAGFFPTIELVAGVTMGFLIIVGGSLVLNQQLSVATLITFVLYIEQLFFPIRMLAQRYNIFQSVMAAGDKIFTLLDTPIEVDDAPDAVDAPPLKGHVRFEEVAFTYTDPLTAKAETSGDLKVAERSKKNGTNGANGHHPENGHEYESPLPGGENVLKNVTLDVPAGSTVALVGHTGAGKTSIVKLIMRFYDIKEGRLTIDGMDIRRLKQKSLRAQMGVVTQETHLFSGTVLENIRYGRLTATDEEVKASARAVGAEPFILRLENGYDTEVHEGGALLSSGQKQLLAFARALLADPRILILDEATSSIDTQTEKVIQTALTTLLKGRTSFVIAHRLSTITAADVIVVMDHGQIIEKGSHSDLLALGGMYRDLYTMAYAKPIQSVN